MAFEGAAQGAYDLASEWLVDPIPENWVGEAIWQDFFNELTPWTPTIDNNLNAYAVTGEFLAANRLLQSTDEQWFDSNGGLRDPFYQLHSQALLVSLMYAENTHTSWFTIGEDLWNAAFSVDVGLAAGYSISAPGEYCDPAAKMLTAIAYSALDSGQAGENSNYGHVFGNTAIRAMFDDADELGRVFSAGKDSEVLRSALPNLTEALVQFSGLMAKREVNYHDYADQQANPYQPEDGIIRVYDTNGEVTSDASSAHTLSVVIDQALWALAKNRTEPDFVDIGSLGDLLNNMFGPLERSYGTQSVTTSAIRDLYVSLPDGGESEIQKAISELQYSLYDGDQMWILGFASSAYDSDLAALFVI